MNREGYQGMRKESGVVMVEAVYLVVTAMMIIFFTINIGVVFHNRLVLTAIANEAANGVAEVYGNRSKEPFYNFTEYGHFRSRNVYRYLMGGKEELNEMAEKKAKWYAAYLVSENEFSAERSLDFSDIQVECRENDLNVQTLTVTIRRTYPVFILNPMALWDLDPKYEVRAQGTAVCYDVISQMNSISLKNELTDRLDSTSSITKIVNGVVKTVQKLKKHWTK